MTKSLKETGKLRNEMKMVFIELENQLSANNDALQKKMQETSDMLQKKIQETSALTISAMDRFSKKVEAGFLAVEDALEKYLADINKEISSIKKRLDKGNL